MKYKTRKYPVFSACGLNCGLCPRFYTAGKSRCPGCAAEGFSAVHPACGVLSCCQGKELEYCYLCSEYPCKKYDGAGLTDSFITHKNQLRDMDKAKRSGIESYAAELNEKMKILEVLLKDYDDGRRKSYFCLAVNVLELRDIISVMERLPNETTPDAPLKDKAVTAVRLFEETAGQQNISLKLR